MKKEILIHSLFFVAFFLFISLFKRYFQLEHILFWLGGLVGTFLPNVDHLIYIYFFAPHELTSQRINYMVSKKQVWSTFELLARTRSERRRLIFHTAFFQIIFFVLTFWVITSSGSLFGRGFVLAFTLHLIIDQLIDLIETESLDNWFEYPDLNFRLDQEKAVFYWLAGALTLLALGFLF